MIKLPEFDLYLFDLDDTLINTREAYHDAQRTAVMKAYPQLPGRELEQQLVNLKWLCRLFGSGQPENYFTAFIANLPDHIHKSPGDIKRLLETYNGLFPGSLKPFHGVTAYLRRLAELKKPVAVVSNGKTATQLNKLRLTGLDGFFPESACFISEMVSPEQRKPSPHLVELACNSFGIKPHKAVYFGNIAADMVAGNLAGTATALYHRDPDTGDDVPDIAVPDYSVDSWL